MTNHPIFVEHDGEFINVSLVTWAKRAAGKSVQYFQVGENTGDGIDNPSRALGEIAEKLIAELTILSKSRLPRIDDVHEEG